MGSGVDIYYQHPLADLPVVRHRTSEHASELTVKAVRGSYEVRDEVNLPLDGPALREVAKLLKLQGYKPALHLSKLSYNYFLPYVVLSWYSVADLSGQPMTYKGEPAKFVEIELNGAVDWDAVFHVHGESFTRHAGTFDAKASNPFWVGGDVLSDIGAGDVEHFCSKILDGWEKTLRKLGVLDLRINKSLWEMFNHGLV